MDHHKQTVADKLGTSVIQIEAMVEAAEFLVLVINEFPPYKIFIDPLLVGKEGLGFFSNWANLFPLEWHE